MEAQVGQFRLGCKCPVSRGIVLQEQDPLVTFRMSKSSWMMDPTRSREMPSCSAIDLAEIRLSSKIPSYDSLRRAKDLSARPRTVSVSSQ
jgi:hypothetical protein